MKNLVENCQFFKIIISIRNNFNFYDNRRNFYPLLMDSRLQRLKEAQNASGASEKGQRRQRFTAQVINSTAEVEEKERSLETVQLTLRVEEPVKTAETSSESSDESGSSEYDEEFKKMMQRPSKPVLKPVFVSKEGRNLEKASDKMTFSTSTSNRQESRAIVAEILRKDFEAAHVNKSLLVPDALSGAFNPNSVDDSDDPNNFEEEYLSWKLRELLRIKEERDEREAHDREKEEIGRIRNMTEEDRRKIDQEKMEEWMSQPKSQHKFLQKYYHKGAFYQEDHKEILSRDYAQATGSDRSDKDVLPQILQVKDFGKKGKGKWKHLTAEDTTAFDYGWGAKDNSVNFKSVSKMGGMKGDLDNPAKKHKK